MVYQKAEIKVRVNSIDKIKEQKIVRPDYISKDLEKLIKQHTAHIKKTK